MGLTNMYLFEVDANNIKAERYNDKERLEVTKAFYFAVRNYDMFVLKIKYEHYTRYFLCYVEDKESDTNNYYLIVESKTIDGLIVTNTNIIDDFSLEYDNNSHVDRIIIKIRGEHYDVYRISNILNESLCAIFYDVFDKRYFMFDKISKTKYNNIYEINVVNELKVWKEELQ